MIDQKQILDGRRQLLEDERIGRNARLMMGFRTQQFRYLNIATPFVAAYVSFSRQAGWR